MRIHLRDRLPFVVVGDGSKQLCCFLSCKPTWLIGLMLLREVFSYGPIFMRVRLRDRLCFIVAMDASKPSVSFWCYYAKSVLMDMFL